MAIEGNRLRLARERIGLTIGQVVEYEGVRKGHLSEMERGIKHPTGAMIARLARRYKTSADYLLGLVDNPSPNTSEPLAPTIQALIDLAMHLSPARQDELLQHARVLADADLAADLAEYDRMMAIVMALPDGDVLRESVEEALRTDLTGGRVAALRIIDAYIAGRTERLQSGQEQSKSL